MGNLIMYLRSYLDGYLSREEFERWFYDLAFDVERYASPSFVNLVHRVEALLAESSSGSWPVEVLHAELALVLEPLEDRHALFVINSGVRSRSSISSPVTLVEAKV
jgi:hypothetical protein